MPINKCQYKRCDVEFKTLHSATKYCCKKCRRCAIQEGRMFFYYGIKFDWLRRPPLLSYGLRRDRYRNSTNSRGVSQITSQYARRVTLLAYQMQ